MSDKLKVIGSDELFEAIYPGDTAYRAYRDASGALCIIELPSRDTVIVAPDQAAELIDALRNASDFHGYDDGQINAIQHWLLARAFARIHPPREEIPALGHDEWPMTTPRFAA